MNKLLYTIGGAAAFFLIAVVVLGPESLQNIGGPTVKNSIWDDSVWQVEEFLQSTLNDADSYQSVEWGLVYGNEYRYYVSHKYRAKNSFGAYMLKYESFTLDGHGNVISVMDLGD